MTLSRNPLTVETTTPPTIPPKLRKDLQKLSKTIPPHRDISDDLDLLSDIIARLEDHVQDLRIQRAEHKRRATEVKKKRAGLRIQTSTLPEEVAKVAAKIGELEGLVGKYAGVLL